MDAHDPIVSLKSKCLAGDHIYHRDVPISYIRELRKAGVKAGFDSDGYFICNCDEHQREKEDALKED